MKDGQMRISGAEAVVRILKEQGATTVFGYPGGAVLPIYDALYEQRDEISHYLTAHEQGAAHAADGFARATGKTGVVLATSGPGSTNLVTGIATAFMDSVPLVAITGNVGSTLIGKDSFQEVYTTGITLPITKHNFFVQDAGELVCALREAFAIAQSGRKGPVLVDITKDAQAALCDWEPEIEGENTVGAGAGAGVDVSASVGVGATMGATTAAPAQADIDKAFTDIEAAQRPLIIFGGGVLSADASIELYELIHQLHMPATHSIMGTGVLGFDDPLNLGLAGMHGRVSANRALAAADLIITLGFRFSDRVALDTKHWGLQARIIQIDIDPSEIDKNVEVEAAIIGDVHDVLRMLSAKYQKTHRQKNTGVAKARNTWLAQIERWRTEDYHPSNSATSLKPHQVIGTIAKLAGPDAIFTTDVGQHQMWAAQFSERTRPRSFLTSGGLGTMGFGYGAAIGAQIGSGGGHTRKRPVIHITGDGSFHMNLNEACTAVSYRLPIISVIFNNQVLGMVRQWQKTFYDAHYSATTLDRVTDYVKVAEGFGAVGIKATTIEEFEAAFARALTVEGPVWIECVIDRDEQVLPMIPAGGNVDDTIVD
jgi:acetolactate synthase-1/2/3 large subunit